MADLGTWESKQEALARFVGFVDGGDECKASCAGKSDATSPSRSSHGCCATCTTCGDGEQSSLSANAIPSLSDILSRYYLKVLT